ncbi:MAG: acetylglutamate kinase [Vicinamibacterales bacterium]
MTTRLTLLKLGGELLERPEALQPLAATIERLAAAGPLVVVHGGGRDIDAECARRGIVKRAVDGLRITDAETLDAVVAALAGTVNTRLVACLVARGLPAVGLTGVDARLVVATRTPPHASVAGPVVDLGLVGTPGPDGSVRLVTDLLDRGYLPVVATLGLTDDGQLLNVNADTLAADLAARLRASHLVIAGGTAGVFDAAGATMRAIDAETAQAMTTSGAVSAGMVAKLTAAFDALALGVGTVRIVDGRESDLMDEGHGTTVVTGRASRDEPMTSTRGASR